MRQNYVFIMTLRQKNDVFIVIVRHTPAFAFVHRFAIGTASGSSFSPLREGCRKAAGCVAPSSIDNPGVSHHQTIYSVAPSGLYACCGGFARLTIGNDIGHR